MAVITMSRQVGSRAEELANQLCPELGLVAFDKKLRMSVAADFGFSEDEIVDYTEELYQRRNYFPRPAQPLITWGSAPFRLEHVDDG